MPSNEKKGITVKIDADLHAEIREYLKKHEMTMAEFITLAVQDELHPKINMTEAKTMGNMRTLAFQVPEELFQQIKDYLQRNNISQKDFVIGLIETEIERDLTQRAAQSDKHTESEEKTEEEQAEQQETAAVSDCENPLEEIEERPEEQGNSKISDDFDGEDEETENLCEDEEMDEAEEPSEDEEQVEDQIDEQEEDEDIGLSMNM
ncbi:MAG: hypothetical protein NC247_14525 [Ruminococcus flavefaciens]|nr:hypothetical protein [Ruminococcus flavefaciens]MCM1486739.1 hypothetical protein [Bacillota bacterium]